MREAGIENVGRLAWLDGSSRTSEPVLPAPARGPNQMLARVQPSGRDDIGFGMFPTRFKSQRFPGHSIEQQIHGRCVREFIDQADGVSRSALVISRMIASQSSELGEVIATFRSVKNSVKG